MNKQQQKQPDGESQAFVKLFKDIVKQEWFLDSVATQVYTYLCIKARNFKSEYPKGVFLGGYRQIMKDLNKSNRPTIEALALLEKADEIFRILSRNKQASIIAIRRLMDSEEWQHIREFSFEAQEKETAKTAKQQKKVTAKQSKQQSQEQPKAIDILREALNSEWLFNACQLLGVTADELDGEAKRFALQLDVTKQHLPESRLLSDFLTWCRKQPKRKKRKKTAQKPFNFIVPDDNITLPF